MISVNCKYISVYDRQLYLFNLCLLIRICSLWNIWIIVTKIDFRWKISTTIGKVISPIAFFEYLDPFIITVLKEILQNVMSLCKTSLLFDITICNRMTTKEGSYLFCCYNAGRWLWYILSVFDLKHGLLPHRFLYKGCGKVYHSGSSSVLGRHGLGS
jgi:hypothetical protein